MKNLATLLTVLCFFSGFSMAQVPFSEENIIEQACQATLTLMNAQGKQLETLASRKYPPGHYSVRFNGDEYPSGIYFYRLQAGSFSKTIKMILLK